MTEHLTDAELRDFAVGKLSQADVLRADDHLSECDRCRMRAAGLSDAAGSVDDFRTLLKEPALHLSDDELQLFVVGQLSPSARNTARTHVETCSTCAKQVEDLRSWAGPAPAARTPFRWLALAAAVLIALVIPAVIWQSRSARPATPASLIGLEALPPAEQACVRAALTAGTASLPDFMTDLSASREVLMGAPGNRGDTFDLIAPVATGTVRDRPQFQWETLAGASGYAVTVFDEGLNVMARSGTIMQTAWTPVDALPRSRTYVWQVTAYRGRESITSPAAPSPPARFRVIGEREAEELQRLEALYTQSHLLLGILNMDAGIRDAAIGHLRQVKPEDAYAEVSRRSLEKLQALSPQR